ncbi:MAG: hypothetical protein PHD82_08775 [Candidatus Riflebacteria bacterium]|nr:hypothetical protein [Candidatus Riflebacteria bacterium]
MTTVNFKAVILALILANCAAGSLLADDMGLIIPMPGQKDIEKASTSQNVKPVAQPVGQKPNKGSSEVFISLPSKIKPIKPQPKPATPAPEGSAEQGKAMIQIELPKPVEKPTSESTFPAPPDEVTISSGEVIDDLLPPAPPPEVPAGDSGAEGQTLPVFPKDTSSAIFMVMKTWQAEDYDGATLLKHAIETYGKEADDIFQIQGLAEDDGVFKINVEEEDITLDELLDIIAMKSGRDWGVDIPNRTIYFYPKGVKTDNYNVW